MNNSLYYSMVVVHRSSSEAQRFDFAFRFFSRSFVHRRKDFDAAALRRFGAAANTKYVTTSPPWSLVVACCRLSSPLATNCRVISGISV